MNIAKPTSKAEWDFSDETEDNVYFHLEDTTHEFVMGLKDILKCVKIAEEKGFIPRLPKEWWHILSNSYVEFREYNTPPEDENE